MSLDPTPGQTVGPFYSFGLVYDGGPDLVPAGHPDAVRLRGRVLDGAGEPVPDALLELWQADPEGRVVREAGSLGRDGSTFTGWGRCTTDPEGHYAFRTLEPGSVGGSLPFFAVTVFARGLLHRLLTRAYLPAPEADLIRDPLLSGLPPDRRATLVATREGPDLVWDVQLQGAGETVFLRHPGHRD